MKKVIIGIHGLGNKPPENQLRNWWEAAIKEGFSLHKYTAELPKFEMIYWADILYDKPLNVNEKDVESPYYLGEPYVKSNLKPVEEDYTLRKKVIDFISDQLNQIFLNEDLSLNYRFVSDYILKNYFRDLDKYYIDECRNEQEETCKVKDLIRKRITDTLEKYRSFEIMLIAHSMGSIVSFDVLSFVQANVRIHTLVTIGSPLGLPVVISKIAAESAKQIAGKNTLFTPPGVSENWYNLADIYDKVALNYKLGDDFSANEAGVAPIDFLVHNDYEINEHKNHHKSYGYLRSPEMSKIVYDFIAFRRKSSVERFMESFGRLASRLKANLKRMMHQQNPE